MPLVVTAEDLVGTHTFRGVHHILNDNTIAHDLYTATTSVNLGPESEMAKGVESRMKRLPLNFKCKAVYVGTLHPNDSSLLITLVLV